MSLVIEVLEKNLQEQTETEDVIKSRGLFGEWVFKRSNYGFDFNYTSEEQEKVYDMRGVPLD